ncbi:hypothetical protein [Mesorhizobium sp. 1B3]
MTGRLVEVTGRLVEVTGRLDAGERGRKGALLSRAAGTMHKVEQT